MKNEKQTLQTPYGEAYCCKFCLRSKKNKKSIISFPRIIKIDDLYYAQCPNCNSLNKWECLGLRESKALEAWNICQKTNS